MPRFEALIRRRTPERHQNIHFVTNPQPIENKGMVSAKARMLLIIKEIVDDCQNLTEKEQLMPSVASGKASIRRWDAAELRSASSRQGRTTARGAASMRRSAVPSPTPCYGARLLLATTTPWPPPQRGGECVPGPLHTEEGVGAVQLPSFSRAAGAGRASSRSTISRSDLPWLNRRFCNRRPVPGLSASGRRPTEKGLRQPAVTKNIRSPVRSRWTRDMPEKIPKQRTHDEKNARRGYPHTKTRHVCATPTSARTRGKGIAQSGASRELL